VKHRTTPQFWDLYEKLPKQIQRLADNNFELLKADPHHPSLKFKKVGNMWSARVGLTIGHLRSNMTEPCCGSDRMPNMTN
jgi:hypothetical protein